jgi:hypothetical protein
MDSVRTRNDPASDYLARCATDPLLLNSLRDLQIGGSSAHYPKIALPRPVFAPRAALVDLADDVLALLGIYESLPDRCFGGDRVAYMTAQGYSGRHIALHLSGLTDGAVALGRIDALNAGGTLKIMEINFDSSLGGLGVAKLCRGLMGDPHFRAFADDHGLHFDDPLEPFARELRQCAKEVVGVDDPLVALVHDDEGVLSYGRALVEDFAKLGLRAVACTADEVGVQKGKIVVPGPQPVDVVFRFFLMEDVVLGRLRDDRVEMLAHAHRDGRTALYTGFDTDAHSPKGALALLYDPGVFPALTPPERAVVERRVPWTRVVRSTDHDVIERCRTERAALVLKPASGFHGDDVLLGAETTDENWNAAMSAPDRAYVVQERLHPEPELVIDPDTGQTEQWDANLGVYFGRNGYTGTWIRARPSADAGIIGMNERTKPGCAFTY